MQRSRSLTWEKQRSRARGEMERRSGVTRPEAAERSLEGARPKIQGRLSVLRAKEKRERERERRRTILSPQPIVKPAQDGVGATNNQGRSMGREKKELLLDERVLKRNTTIKKKKSLRSGIR